MSHELADITTCRICGQIFSGPRIAIIGQQNGRFENFMQGLGKHLTEKHPEQSKLMMQHGAAFMEMLFLMQFQTNDPQLTKQRDFIRWQVHQQTLNATIPDEKLQAQCRGLAMILAQSAIESLVKLKTQCNVLGGEPAESELLTDSYLSAQGRDMIAECFNLELIEVFTGIRDVLQEPGKYPVPSGVTLH